MSYNVNSDKNTEILFVDDESGILEQAKIFLEKENEKFKVTTAADADKALNLMEKNDFNVVISDYKMPGMDGLEFLKILREEKSNETPFILLTGKGKEEVAMKAINTGANGYLQKGSKAKAQYRKLAHLISREIEYRETEKALQKSEEKYRLIFKKNPIGLLECDTDGRIVDINERMLEILGAPDKETALGAKIMDFGNEEETGMIEDIKESIENEKVIDAKRRLTTPWDEEIQISFRILPLTDDNGEVVEMTVACHDVIFY